MSGMQITDYLLQYGQRSHGRFGGANTLQFMAAIRPDCKKRFVDLAPVSNADIAPTFAQILGLDISSKGELKGRVLREAQSGGPSSVLFARRTAISERAANGMATILMYQQLEKQVYFDQACFVNATAAKAQNTCP
jgi:hypothetical protein